MAVNPLIEDGQETAAHQGQASGLVDTKEQSDADTTTQTVAEQIAQVAIAFQQERTGHSPQAATVVLKEDELIVTLQAALSPAEQALAQSPEGAAQVQESHRQLLANSCEPLRQEIERITGVASRGSDCGRRDVRPAPWCRYFRLAESVPAEAWSGNSPDGCT